MNINYDYYKIFYYVAKYKNITKAAQVLLNNQPNITRTIKILENELGCVLFTRNNKGMALTPEGERLFIHVESALKNIEDGEKEIIESKNLENGSIYIATSEVALHCVLLPIIKKFHKIYPKIKLRISNLSTPQAIEEIKNGTAEIALVTTPTIPNDEICEQKIYSFNEIAICGNDFNIKDESISFKELLTYPIISLSQKTKSYELYSSFFLKQSLVYQPEIYVATANQIVPFVKANLGIGFIAKEFIEEIDNVKIIKLKEQLPKREIHLIKKRNKSLSIASKELEKLILDETKSNN